MTTLFCGNVRPTLEDGVPAAPVEPAQRRRGDDRLPPANDPARDPHDPLALLVLARDYLLIFENRQMSFLTQPHPARGVERFFSAFSPENLYIQRPHYREHVDIFTKFIEPVDSTSEAQMSHETEPLARDIQLQHQRQQAATSVL